MKRGGQDSTVSVFTEGHDSKLRHLYTARPSMAEDVKERGLDLPLAVYNVLGSDSAGRGDWYASFGCPAKIQFQSQWRLKNRTSRSCRSASGRVLKVPGFRRLTVSRLI